jgi:hypothetical protein
LAPGCPRAFQPWEVDDLFAHFKPIALDNLVTAGKIREDDQERVTFVINTIVYPPEREGEEDKYAEVRPLLKALQEASARR